MLRAKPLWAGLRAEERFGEWVLLERHPEVGDDLRGGVEPVEDAQERRADVVAATGPGRCGVPGELQQVVALVEGEPQRAGERADRLLGGPRAAALLEPRVEVGRHVRERRDLLSTQTRRAPAAAGAEADVLGLQRLTAAAEEVGEALAIHPRSIGQAAGLARDTLSLASDRSLRTAAGLTPTAMARS